MATLHKKGAEAWKDVTNASQWVDEMRGHETPIELPFVRDSLMDELTANHRKQIHLARAEGLCVAFLITCTAYIFNTMSFSAFLILTGAFIASGIVLLILASSKD